MPEIRLNLLLSRSANLPFETAVLGNQIVELQYEATTKKRCSLACSSTTMCSDINSLFPSPTSHWTMWTKDERGAVILLKIPKQVCDVYCPIGKLELIAVGRSLI